MKEVTRNTVSPRYIPFVFVFDIPETENTKGKDNVKVTIYIPPYDEYGKGPDTQYMETVAELLAEADWQNISIDEYSKELENGDFISIPDEDWEYNIDYRGVKRTTFAEKIDVLLKDEAIPNEDKKKLSLLKELSPREILQNTKTMIQVLDLLKKTYHPKNGYNLSDFEQRYNEARLYELAVAYFDEFGDYVVGSWNYRSYHEERGIFRHHLKPNFWYAVREMLSLGEFKKFASVNGVFVETPDIKLPLENFRGRIGTVRIAYFDSKEHFNPMLMKLVTSIKGNFALTDSSSIPSESKQVLFSSGDKDKDATYRIYEYDHSLLAVIKEQEVL